MQHRPITRPDLCHTAGMGWGSGVEWGLGFSRFIMLVLPLNAWSVPRLSAGANQLLRVLNGPLTGGGPQTWLVILHTAFLLMHCRVRGWPPTHLT